ncbi:MAG: hypothetical protein RLZZ396_2969, partial [Planctomycetota bacterium]
MESMDQESESTEPLQRSFRDPIDESRFRTAMATRLPIQLEIGSGKGLFLTNAACANSN